MMKRPLFLSAPLALVLLAGCGGSTRIQPPAPATTLVYTDPASGTGDWKLVKDATSTGTHLVLNLVGPTDGTLYRGVGFNLQTDPAQVAFAKFRDDQGQVLGFHQDLGIFLDKTPVGGDMAPSLQTSGVREGMLTVGIFQKSDNDSWNVAKGDPYDGATAKDCGNTAVLQVALDLDPALKAMPGPVTLTVTKTRVISQAVGLNSLTRKVRDAVLKVGTLALK
jgi:hypothetical protein